MSYCITETIQQVQEKVKLRRKVCRIYNSTSYFNPQSKKEVMPKLSMHFSKNEMRKVFSALKENGIILE